MRLGVLAASDDNSSGDAYAMGEMVTGEMVTSETRAIKSGGMSAKVIFMRGLSLPRSRVGDGVDGGARDDGGECGTHQLRSVTQIS